MPENNSIAGGESGKSVNIGNMKPIITEEEEIQAAALAWHKIVTTIYENKYIPVSQTLPSKKQVQFLAYEGMEALFGGSAGSGKSLSLLMAALQYVDVPGYSALLLRRTYRQLMAPGGLIELSKSWIGSKAQWREKSMNWTFDSGATLGFSYYDNDADFMLHQGSAYTYVGFDELTQFREPWYLYLFSRTRKIDWLCKHCRQKLVRTPTMTFAHHVLGACENAEPIPQATNKNGIALPDVPIRIRAACVDEGDVLTTEGWKPIQDIQVGDPVYSLNGNGDVEVKPVINTYAYSYDGPLVRVDKTNLYMSITPNHRIYHRAHRELEKRPGTIEKEHQAATLRLQGRSFGFIADALGYKSRTSAHRSVRRSIENPRTLVGRSLFEITQWDEIENNTIFLVRSGRSFVSNGYKGQSLNLPVNVYLAILGFFLSEGCTCKPRKGNYKVVFTQVEKGNHPRIRALLDQLGVNYCLCSNGDFQITKKEWWDHFRVFGKAHEKFIPRQILKEASVEELEILFSWMVFGDGSIRNSQGRPMKKWEQEDLLTKTLVYHTVSPRLADDVMEIGVRLGWKAQVSTTKHDNPKHRDRQDIYLSHRKESTVPTTLVEKHRDENTIHYEGNVYCIQVADNENFIIRQKGKAWVSGNSNPGGPGHNWVKNRFVVQGAPKVFVPALLDDNPGLNKEDYVKSLANLDPITRAQLLQGSWDAYSGGRFDRKWFRAFWVEPDRNGNPVYLWAAPDTEGVIHNGWPTCPIGGIPVSVCWNLITVDPAASDEDKADYTVIGVFAITPTGEVLTLEIVRERLSIEKIIPRVEQLCYDYSPQFVGIEDVAFQLGIVREGQRSLGVAVERLKPEGKGKLVRATPAVIRASEGQIFVPKDEPKGAYPWLEDYLAELVQWTGDEKMDSHDDCVDVLAYAVLSLAKHGLACPIVIQPTEEEYDIEREMGIFLDNGESNHGGFWQH